MTPLLIVLATACSILFGFGCGEKQQSVEMFPKEGQAAQATSEVAAISVPAVVSPTPILTADAMASSASPLPTEPMERTKMVQTALKNASLYTGAIDGKMGPLTEQAVRSFQSAHNLKADGKVGPLTWTELSKHLASSSTSAAEGVQQ